MSGSVKVDGQSLTTLSNYFRELDETAANGYRTRLDSVHISGDLTGRACPQAGDAVKKAMQALSANVKDFGSHAEDICAGLRNTAKNYSDTDSAHAANLSNQGGDL
ncbi:hypothetical protein GCM10010174_08640 [Kutzneria viridogrisea]|uniref:ESX-1 secretion-associated protein n=2 Tax=Kutzneria TaxID=43356 RepID=W5WL06_9PSEU|nr:type VII secretion target [Kutzneria albida]AHI01533.1 hypothetical protein KALB_8175 [Kutzneria albida DSM 43870]MBA8931497.1 hypothetical protein [Kutzneria viridogrisea]